MNKVTIIIILVVFVIIVIGSIALYYTGKGAGKKDKPTKIEPPKTGADGKELSTSDSSTVRRISTEMFEDMDDTPVFGNRNDLAYKTFMNMNDNLFASTINDFNSRYMDLGQGGLREWLMSEVFYWDLDTWVTDTILPRMASMNATQRVAGSSMRRV